MLNQFPETTLVALTFNDRLGRRVMLLANNDQHCITGAWIEEDTKVEAEMTVDNTTLYNLLVDFTKA